MYDNMEVNQEELIDLYEEVSDFKKGTAFQLIDVLDLEVEEDELDQRIYIKIPNNYSEVIIEDVINIKTHESDCLTIIKDLKSNTFIIDKDNNTLAKITHEKLNSLNKYFKVFKSEDNANVLNFKLHKFDSELILPNPDTKYPKVTAEIKPSLANNYIGLITLKRELFDLDETIIFSTVDTDLSRLCNTINSMIELSKTNNNSVQLMQDVIDSGVGTICKCNGLLHTITNINNGIITLKQIHQYKLLFKTITMRDLEFNDFKLYNNSNMYIINNNIVLYIDEDFNVKFDPHIKHPLLDTIESIDKFNRSIELVSSIISQKETTLYESALHLINEILHDTVQIFYTEILDKFSDDIVLNYVDIEITLSRASLARSCDLLKRIQNKLETELVEINKTEE